jgi:prephenate dehydrogenase
MSAAGSPRRLLVVGFGLLGASIALAARRASADARITAVDPKPDAREAARALGFEGAPASPDRVDHDLVVVCVPFDGAKRAMGDLAPRLARGSCVTDVAGLKDPLVSHAEALHVSYPDFHYVGAHPLSGSHLRGARNARADLLEGAPCALVRCAASTPEGESRVEAFWQGLGCRTEWMSAAAHDRMVAVTSALPLVVAAALAGTARQKVGKAATTLSGVGLRDSTRLAASPPELWAGLLAANRAPLLQGLELFVQQCERWKAALESGDRDAVKRLLEEQRRARAALFPEVVDADA